MAAVEAIIHVTVLADEYSQLKQELDLETVALTTFLSFSGNISLRPEMRSTIVSSSKKSSIGGGVSMAIVVYSALLC